MPYIFSVTRYRHVQLFFVDNNYRAVYVINYPVVYTDTYIANLPDRQIVNPFLWRRGIHSPTPKGAATACWR